MPDNRATLEESIRSYTHDGAYAGFMEDKTGMLKAGMLADVAVLSADLEKTDPAEFRDVRVKATISDGRVVYES